MLKIVMNKRLEQFYCSKLLPVILEMIMLLIIGLLELDELMSLFSNFVIMAIPQVK